MDLEGADDGENVHLRNPKLSLIFNNNDNIPPQPPPRKHKKNFREKIESVAKNSLQAFQSKNPSKNHCLLKRKLIIVVRFVIVMKSITTETIIINNRWRRSDRINEKRIFLLCHYRIITN